jgi:hypothetical protein
VLSWLIFLDLDVDSEAAAILTACDSHYLRHENKSVLVHIQGEFLCEFTGEIAKLLSESRLIWNIGADDSSHLDRVVVNRVVRLTD